MELFYNSVFLACPLSFPAVAREMEAVSLGASATFFLMKAEADIPWSLDVYSPVSDGTGTCTLYKEAKLWSVDVVFPSLVPTPNYLFRFFDRLSKPNLLNCLLLSL